MSAIPMKTLNILVNRNNGMDIAFLVLTRPPQC